MALDADEVVIGSFGHVYVGPVGTVGPSDPTTALNAAFVELGFLSEDGVTFTPGVDLNEVPAWQSPYPVRRKVTGRTLDLEFTMLQMNQTTLPFALGGGGLTTLAGVHRYTPPVGDVVDERALVVDWQDGDKHYRMHVLRGLVSDLGGFTVNRTDAVGLEVTFSLLAEGEIAPYDIYSDDPAWAAA